MRPTLDEALEYVVDDELVEVISSFVCVERHLGHYHWWYKFTASVFFMQSYFGKMATAARQSSH